MTNVKEMAEVTTYQIRTWLGSSSENNPRNHTGEKTVTRQNFPMTHWFTTIKIVVSRHWGENI